MLQLDAPPVEKFFLCHWWQFIIIIDSSEEWINELAGIWLLQSCGSIFYMSTSTNTNSCNRLQEIAAPTTIDDLRTTNSVTFATFSATPDALCGLMMDGRLLARTGMGPHCPTGVNWMVIDLPDLGQQRLNFIFSLVQHNNLYVSNYVSKWYC